MTSDFEGFSIPDFIHYIYFPILILESWERDIFPFLMLVLNKGTTGTIFITSLVWRGHVGIEPWTSRTRCQHSTTRLSRRWFTPIEQIFIIILKLSSKIRIYFEKGNLNSRKKPITASPYSIRKQTVLLDCVVVVVAVVKTSYWNVHKEGACEIWTARTWFFGH